MYGTAKAVEYLAKLQDLWKLFSFIILLEGLSKILFFGDDKDFMDTLAKMVVNGSFINEKKSAYMSTFSEISEFYISSRLCKSFLLSASSSTFGWWLAFFARGQDAVYYYKDGRVTDDFKITHDEFQLK
ncbi:hypothetical protein OESDEN_03260 [Oesophagostomum dentatum]|uniref:Uncharacterized protein n=1 Tax=Oesophagostomum dentatum TaxID=61180 RepID=A0A0B1TN00_OESDE|nr:hypothetical protein OESDEN_03260 [Oesophagostomum dentatum]